MSPRAPKNEQTHTARMQIPSLAMRRRLTNDPSMSAVNGIAIPMYMTMPGQDGYRTPMGEDYERYEFFQNRRTREKHPLQVSPALPGHDTPTQSRNRLNLSVVSEKLEQKLAWRLRLRHFTWTFFTSTMATGGIANVLYNVPFRFHGIDTIGTIFFLFNIVLFIINCICISTRFWLFPETFKASLTHPTESLFMPAAVVSFGTILINISQYGLYNVGDWLNMAVVALFWLDVVLALLASSGTYLLIWSTQTFTIAQMTPIWIFPVYPLLVIGPHAGVLSKALDPERAFIIIIGGFTAQGIGYLVSLMIYAAYIYRLMTQKLPQESVRPGMFVSVGPSGFTCAALINMAENTSRAFSPDFMGDGRLAATILTVMASWVSLWIWGMAVWFFLIAVGAHVSCIGHGRLRFAMNWFSFVFPNTALITATFAIAKAFDIYSLEIIGCALTCILIFVWFFVFGAMLRAIYLKQILWPQKQEDRDEGGFKAPQAKVGSVGAALLRRRSNTTV